MLFQSSKFFRKLRIAQLVGVEIYNGDAHTVFHFARAEVVQERPPAFVLFEIFGDVLGKENVPGVPAIHNPLRHVEASSAEIGVTIYIYDTAHTTAVHANPNL